MVRDAILCDWIDSAKLVAGTAIAFLFVAPAPAQPQPACSAADSVFETSDDAAAQSTIADALARDELACAIALLQRRHVVLAARDERTATIARFSLRDLTLPILGQERLSDDQRLELVLAAITPTAAANTTAIDVRADAKLLRLAARQFLDEQAYGAWLDAFAAWIPVRPRVEGSARSLLILNRSEEPFIALWKAGETDRVLAFMRQAAGEPDLGDLRTTLGGSFFRADECSNGREMPTDAMVAMCRTQLRSLAELEALGCWSCHPAGTSQVTLEAATVLFRSGAIIEATAAVEHAIEILNALPPKDRSPALTNAATHLERIGYSPARVGELREEAETLRLTQYQPLFPPVP